MLNKTLSLWLFDHVKLDIPFEEKAIIVPAGVRRYQVMLESSVHAAIVIAFKWSYTAVGARKACLR